MEFKEITTLDDIQTYLIEHDVKKDNDKFDGSLMSLIFEDGEHVATKAGSLLFQRGMHQSNPAIIFDDAHKFKLPNTYGKHSYVMLQNADGIWKKIKEIYLKEHQLPTEMSEEDIRIVKDYLQTCSSYFEKAAKVIKEKREEFYKIKDRTQEQDEHGTILHILQYCLWSLRTQTDATIHPSPQLIYQIELFANPLKDDLKQYIDIIMDEKEISDEYWSNWEKLRSLMGKYNHLIH
jgi:hypothetical protein